MVRFRISWPALAVCALAATACVDDEESPTGFPTAAPPRSYSVLATNATYTLDGEFDQGVLFNVNHDAPNSNQLQLNRITQPFPFVYIALSGKGTAVRIDVNSGAVLAEFQTAPNFMGRDPSRTTVDQLGNVWVTNRQEFGGGKGSVARYGLVIGGTRVNADGTANPLGDYLKSPFSYNTCVDRDGDNLIRTSRGLGHVLPWTNAGSADSNGGVSTAADECIINYTRVTGTGARTVAVDRNNDVWVGGLADRDHEKLSGVTGQPVPGTQFNYGCGGYGGLIDRNGVLWSARTLLRFDPATNANQCFFDDRGVNGYGMGVDPNSGNVWMSSLGGSNRVWEFNGAGGIVNSYPQPFGGAQGLAVDANSHVWVAEIFGSRVAHYAPDPANPSQHILVGVVTGFAGTTGVAVDANGKIWASEIQASPTRGAARINPLAGPVGAAGIPVGAIDLTVGLGFGTSPYNYSDMTGFVSVGATSPQGSWSIVQDGGAAGTLWGKVTWNQEAAGYVPPGGSIVVEARTAESEAGLSLTPFVAVGNGTSFSLTGRYIEVRATLRAAPDGTSPVLSDLKIETAVIEVKGQMKPGSNPPSFSIKSKGSIPLAIYSTQTANGEAVNFDATTIDVSTVTVGVAGVEIHGKLHIEDAAELGEPAGDVDLDAVLHVDFQKIGLQCGDMLVTITGKTTTGDSFIAKAVIRLTGC